MSKATVGDKIRIINAEPVIDGFQYENGDEFTVGKVWGDDYDDGVDTDTGLEIFDCEFEVINSDYTDIEEPNNPGYLIAKLTERVSELESVIRRMKEALANG